MNINNNHRLEYTELVQELTLYTLNDIIAMYFEGMTNTECMEDHISENMTFRIDDFVDTINTEIEEFNNINYTTKIKGIDTDRNYILEVLMDFVNDLNATMDNNINSFNQKKIKTSNQLEEISNQLLDLKNKIHSIADQKLTDCQ